MIGIMSESNFRMMGVLTASGSAEVIIFSLSRTSLVRSSMSCPYSNSSVMSDIFSAEREVMCLRLATELSVLSKGRVTLFSISDALAPE